jgi:hypothetical protein
MHFGHLKILFQTFDIKNVYNLVQQTDYKHVLKIFLGTATANKELLGWISGYRELSAILDAQLFPTFLRPNSWAQKS